jgi:S-adenosylmethionine:tRNA ribosyltransferase-isomerase
MKMENTSPYLLTLAAYQYELPQELIAQVPHVPRDHSRLLLVDKQKGELSEIKFFELADFLQEEDHLVFNDTKVIPARIFGNRLHKTVIGGDVEIVLLKRLSHDTWEALAKPGKKLKIGTWIQLGEDFKAEILNTTLEGTKILRFSWEGLFEDVLNRYGQLPLPHYIQRSKPSTTDVEQYQTVFAANSGASAAPTAGLHFTQRLLDELSIKGIVQNKLTLHVGLGTFRPVKSEDIRLHQMHTEKVIIPGETAVQLNQKDKNKKCICIGTTCCRALESAATAQGIILPGQYETNIFIYPGYRFKYVNALLTNFHLPRSSLLMLVSAFGGYELIKEAYQKAIKDRFRFYSYGDAMLIF